MVVRWLCWTEQFWWRISDKNNIRSFHLCMASRNRDEVWPMCMLDRSPTALWLGDPVAWCHWMNTGMVDGRCPIMFVLTQSWRKIRFYVAPTFILASRNTHLQHNVPLPWMKLSCIMIAFVVFLDATKAFDRIDFCKLFRMLLDRYMPSLLLRLLFCMYTNQNLQVRWDSIAGTPPPPPPPPPHSICRLYGRLLPTTEG